MNHLVPRTRESLEVGDSGTFTKTITEADILAFADASGDFNPLHVDDEYARRSAFGQRVAHGILTAAVISAVLGSELPGVGTILVSIHVRFLRPVFIGDVVTAEATVIRIINSQRVQILVACRNEDGKDVAIGNAIVIPPPQTKLIDETPGKVKP